MYAKQNTLCWLSPWATLKDYSHVSHVDVSQNIYVYVVFLKYLHGLLPHHKSMAHFLAKDSQHKASWPFPNSLQLIYLFNISYFSGKVSICLYIDCMFHNMPRGWIVGRYNYIFISQPYSVKIVLLKYML